VILAFLSHLVNKDECFVGIPGCEIWVSEDLVGFGELETVHDAVGSLCRALSELEELILPVL
jgi:hypothetical protein